MRMKEEHRTSLQLMKIKKEHLGYFSSPNETSTARPE